MKEIDRDFENCTCYCDYCMDSELVDSTKYATINKELKSYGWVIKPIDGEWKEFCCKECCEKYMKEKVKTHDTREHGRR